MTLQWYGDPVVADAVVTGRDNQHVRERVDALLEHFIERFYREVPYARHLVSGDDLDLDYYKRHNIETILRLRRKRTVDALALGYFTKHDPVRAAAWSRYCDDEMLHDSMFAADLEKVGVTREEIYATEPLLSTKLLTGYLQYTLEYEGTPLAHIASVYFVEFTTTRTQPAWLDNIAKHLGEDKVSGGRAHVSTDVDDDHVDEVWDVLTTLVRSPEDEERLIGHLWAIYRLWEAYFYELHDRVVGGVDEQSPALATSRPRQMAATS